MIIVPEPTTSSDQLIELLAWKWSKREKGLYSSWSIVTMSACKMFLNQGFAADFRAKSPMILSVCNHLCCVRHIPRSPSENEKLEDVFYPFVDEEMIREKWEYALFFKEEEVDQHFHYRMIGWTYRKIVMQWKRHKLQVIHHGKYEHDGVRGFEGDLMDPESFYKIVVFPESFPFLISHKEKEQEEKELRDQKAQEIAAKSAPKDIEW